MRVALVLILEAVAYFINYHRHCGIFAARQSNRRIVAANDIKTLDGTIANKPMAAAAESSGRNRRPATTTRKAPAGARNCQRRAKAGAK